MAKHKRGVSRSRREDALQRDAEVEGQIRLHVVVRIVGAGKGKGFSSHLRQRAVGI